MKSSKLWAIFQQLSSKEIRELDKFLQSPYFNQREDVILLYQYLSKAKMNSKMDISKKEVFKFLFPNQAFNEKNIRYSMSFLYKNIKQFLAIRTIEEDPLNMQIALIQSFRKKGQQKLFEQAFKIAEQDLEKQPFRNQNYYFQNFRLQRERYLFTTTHTRQEALGLEASSHYLDQYFIINKLKQSAQALSHQTLNTTKFEPEFIPEILNLITKNNLLDNPSIAVYYYSLKILSTDNSIGHFQQLRALIKDQASIFPTTELKDIYTFALNYCIKRLNAQEAIFRREAFELYREGIKQGIFFENGILSQFNYKNMVALGLGLKEFDWVHQFIEEKKEFLEKKSRESTYAFNLALLHFRKGNYDEAMHLLQKVGTKDVLNNLNARRMLVRIYYDQGNIDALYSLLDSFQNYIYRKREVGYHRNLYLNFIKFTRRLLQLEGLNKQQVEQLKQEIEATKNVAEKVWLLAQLAD
jgi:hypothetical protein